MLAKSQSVWGRERSVTCGLCEPFSLFGLLPFFDPTAPRIRKSSADFPPLIAAANHFGLNPRPAQVSSGFCGLRYFGGTGPLTPNPEPLVPGILVPCRHGEEIHGVAAFIRDARAERLDHDERYGTLWRRNIPGDEPIVMIEVVNRTPELDGRFKHYWLRVPPGVRTAREAVAWTFNMPAGRYAPEIET